MDYTADLTLLIKNIPLFLDLTNQQANNLASVSSLVEIYPGEILIREGETLGDLFILLEGEVKVEIFVPRIGQVETSHLGTFDILGWSAMTPVVRQRTGTVTAITHCWLLRFNRTMLTNLCDEDHVLGCLFYRRLANVVATSFLTTRLELMNQMVRLKSSLGTE